MDELHFSSLWNIFYPSLSAYFKGLYYHNFFSERFLGKRTSEKEGIVHTELQREHKAAQGNGANEHFKTSHVINGSTVN